MLRKVCGEMKVVEYKITRGFTMHELCIIRDALELLAESSPDYAELLDILFILERVNATTGAYSYVEV